MKTFEIGNPEPLCCCYGGIWIDTENAKVQAGGYTQSSVWSSFDPRPNWEKKIPKVEMTLPEFIELVLLGKSRIDSLTAMVESGEKRVEEAEEKGRLLEHEKSVLSTEVQRVKAAKAQSRRDYRKKMKKLVSLL